MSEVESGTLDELTFREAVARLESVVAALEKDTVDLDTALRTYEEGLAIARHLMERLNAAELRVKQLSIE